MKRTLFALILSLCAINAAQAASHKLFKSGKSDYTIVVADNASPSEKFAAEELRDWIREVSGVTIPVKGLGEGRKGRRIVVGYNELLASLLPGTEKPEFSDDAFNYVSRGGDILLWGGAKRGTLYAAYAFLENELGCRWYTSKVSVAPKRDSWSFSRIERHEAPGILVRNDFYLDAFNPLWAARNRSNASLNGFGNERLGGSESFWGGHTFNHFVSPNEFFDEHPEYFSLVGGKRLRDYSQLCLSNPDVLRIITERMRETIRKHPGDLIFSVGQNDWFNPCECENCKAIKEQYGGTESGILIWFVNQVADAIKDEFPDKYIGTFAYQYTREAPENIRPRDNVVVRLCSIEECQIHDMDGDAACKDNLNFVHDLQQWAAIAPHLYIWDYVSTFTQYLAPMPNIWTFQNRIRCFRKYNALGVMPQGNYQSIGTSFDELKAYVLAKLMWNPDCDVDAVIDDFLGGFFGAAAPAIREYMEFERDVTIVPDVHQNCFPLIEDNKIYTEELIDGGREIFRKAYDAVKGDAALTARVERAELALCYMQMILNPRKGYESGSMELIERVMERDGIDRLCEWGGYSSLNAFKRDMSIARYLGTSTGRAGEVKIEEPGTFFYFRTADVEPENVREGDTIGAELVGSPAISFPYKGWNGSSRLYLYLSDLIGGNSNGCYRVEGEIVPDTEYSAPIDLEWREGEVTMSGFDENSEYVIIIKKADKEQVTFKIVKFRDA